MPACVLIATLRKKLKAEEAKLKAEQANKTNKAWYLVIVFLYSHWSSCFSCFLHERKTPIKQ
ncbi:hypothetical protein Hpkin68_02950 [Helicobacter pylori]